MGFIKDLDYLRTSRRMNPIIREGYTYYLKKKATNRWYYECKNIKSFGCPVRAIQYANGDFVLTREHTHAPDEFAMKLKMFKYQLKQMVEDRPTVPFKTIYDELSQLHHEAAARLKYQNVASSMRRWRNLHAANTTS